MQKRNSYTFAIFLVVLGFIFLMLAVMMVISMTAYLADTYHTEFLALTGASALAVFSALAGIFAMSVGLTGLNETMFDGQVQEKTKEWLEI